MNFFASVTIANLVRGWSANEFRMTRQCAKNTLRVNSNILEAEVITVHSHRSYGKWKITLLVSGICSAGHELVRTCGYMISGTLILTMYVVKTVVVDSCPLRIRLLYSFRRVLLCTDLRAFSCQQNMTNKLNKPSQSHYLCNPIFRQLSTIL